MAQFTRIRPSSLHSSVLAGRTWELDILTDITERTSAPSGQQAYVTSLNDPQSGDLYRTTIKLSGSPSTDASGDRRLFAFINGAELPATSLVALQSGDPTDEIKFDLGYELTATGSTTDTIKVWYSV